MTKPDAAAARRSRYSRCSRTLEHDVEGARAAVSRMGRSHRRDRGGVARPRKPIARRRPDRTARMGALACRARRFSRHQQDRPVARPNRLGKRRIEQIIRTGERMAVQVDRPVRRNEPARQTPVPRSIERVRRRWRWTLNRTGSDGRDRRTTGDGSDCHGTDRLSGSAPGGKWFWRRGLLPWGGNRFGRRRRDRAHAGHHALPQCGFVRAEGSVPHWPSPPSGARPFRSAAAATPYRARPCLPLSPLRRDPHPRMCRSGSNL